jgi:hypothetical protein
MNEEVVERLRGLRSRFSTPFYENASYGYGGFVHEHDSKAEEFIQMSRTSVRAQKQAAQVITQVKSAAAPTTANAVQKEMVDKEDKDKLSTAKRKRSSSDTRIALLSPSLPPIFDEALARGKISPAPALLSPTLPPKFITPKQPSPSPDSTDLARTTSRLSETGKSEATMSAGTDPPKSTPAHNTTPNGGNQDLSALAKLYVARLNITVLTIECLQRDANANTWHKARVRIVSYMASMQCFAFLRTITSMK